MLLVACLGLAYQTPALAQPDAASKTIPPSTKTVMVIKTNDVLYTSGLGEAGIAGFCKRLQNHVAENFQKRGVTVSPNSEPGTSEAKIIVTLSSVEAKSGAGWQPFLGPYTVGKLSARYTAILESPDGRTLAAWKHEDDELTADKLSSHMASDIFKYLKKGFK